MADMDLVKKLKIAELRKELTDRGLSSKGNKAELAERLTENLETAGADAVLDNAVDADAVLTAEDDAEDLLNPDEDLDDGDAEDDTDDDTEDDTEHDTEHDTEITRKVELETTEVVELLELKEETVEVKKIIMPPAKPKTDDEKKALRAQKFGVSAPLSDADRKKARAERFGMPTAGLQSKSSSIQPKGISISMDADKLKQRAERFGKSVSPTAMKSEEAERIRKRKERFGAVAAAPGTKTKISANGEDDAEAKKRKRAERFGMA